MKDFIPYQEALELKQLGFDEPCFMFYEQETSSKWLQKGINDDYWGDYSEPQKWNSMPNKPWKPFCQCISAPLYQQAFRWFREEFNLHILIDADVLGYYGHLKINPIGTLSSQTKQEWVNTENYPFKTYEEAELECLKKLIDIVKNDQK